QRPEIASARIAHRHTNAITARIAAPNRQWIPERHTIDRAIRVIGDEQRAISTDEKSSWATEARTAAIRVEAGKKVFRPVRPSVLEAHANHLCRRDRRPVPRSVHRHERVT